MDDSIPNFPGVLNFHFSSPKGGLRSKHIGSPSRLVSLKGRLNQFSELLNWGIARFQRHDQIEFCASRTRIETGRTGFRSTGRLTINQGLSDCIGNDLNRPCQAWPVES